MPRIRDNWLRTVFYMYQTEDAANKGTQSGATGFIAGIKGEQVDANFLYAVTNWHVLYRYKKEFPVIRLTRKDGRSEPFRIEIDDWEGDEHNDLAAVSIPGSQDVHEFVGHIRPHGYLTREEAIEYDVGPGDGAIMIGRFMDNDGGEKTTPAARFGHISMKLGPHMHNGKPRESYCVDIHSRSGFSGSPVFVYRKESDCRLLPDDSPLERDFVRLLGIHRSQFNEEWEVKLRGAILEDVTVKGLSGMTLVTPAWKILELLNRQKFVDARREEEEEMLKNNPSCRRRRDEDE